MRCAACDVDNPPGARFCNGCGAALHAPCPGCGHTNPPAWDAIAHYDDECSFRIQSLVDNVEVTIPFMDVHLPESHKREQYLVWRDQLLDYWEHRARRRRPCTVDGCTQPQRAKGVCRRHYYERFGS